ncbi:hypothetical protein LOD99_2981 [Oopsacas minuta]|uniref:IPT/TIG domain-containing protein n=1 Tax=Oopsacas minuta TaxID=111878 RepID=A0AAV7JZL6_9METZ|nr:hypothetical protein LOD99_2981 [Oopsacas minuta]
MCADDPVYKSSIIIKGTGFSSVKEDEYSITITSTSNQKVGCTILTLTDDNLECIPTSQISGTLRVEIGNTHNCTFTDPISPPDTTFSEQYGYAIVGSSAVILMVVLGIALTLLFCVVIRYYRYRQQRQVKNIIYEYTKLESNIAKECKTGDNICNISFPVKVR